jgi:hypothetical protein
MKPYTALSSTISMTAAHTGIASIPTAATLSRRNVGFGNEPRSVPQITA